MGRPRMACIFAGQFCSLCGRCTNTDTIWTSSHVGIPRGEVRAACALKFAFDPNISSFEISDQSNTSGSRKSEPSQFLQHQVTWYVQCQDDGHQGPYYQECSIYATSTLDRGTSAIWKDHIYTSVRVLSLTVLNA